MSDAEVYEMDYALYRARMWLGTLRRTGVDLTVEAHRKVVHEAEELSADPSLEEWADVMIALQGVALHNGWSGDDQTMAVLAKLSINECRTWTEQPDGTFQHTPQVPS